MTRLRAVRVCSATANALNTPSAQHNTIGRAHTARPEVYQVCRGAPPALAHPQRLLGQDCEGALVSCWQAHTSPLLSRTHACSPSPPPPPFHQENYSKSHFQMQGQMTFAEFVHRLVEQRACLDPPDEPHRGIMNEHWQPQLCFCGLTELKFQYVHFEDVPRLMDQLAAAGLIPGSILVDGYGTSRRDRCGPAALPASQSFAFSLCVPTPSSCFCAFVGVSFRLIASTLKLLWLQQHFTRIACGERGARRRAGVALLHGRPAAGHPQALCRRL